MSIILDAIIVLIVLICALLAAKKGFVRTLIELVGFVLTIIVSISFSSPVADYVYKSAVGPAAESGIATVIEQGGETAFDSLPGFVKNLAEKANITVESISSSAGGSAEEIAHDICETAIMPIATNIIKIIVTLILFAILLIVVKLLAKLINSLFKGVVLGTANKALGAVLGGAKGLIYSVIFCVAVSLIVSITESGLLFATQESIDNSFLCKYILDFLPFEF